MSYHETLTNMIKEKGLSLREISKKCEEEYGVDVAPSYISKLQSGQAPASDKINRAIALVCERDPDELIFEGYMDRAPDVIHKFIGKFTDQILGVIKLQLLSSMPKEALPIIEHQLSTMKRYDIVRFFLMDSTSAPEQAENAFIISDGQEGVAQLLLPRIGVLRMDDDAMYPVINKGEMIQLDDVESIASGDIVVVVSEDGSHMVRRYYESGKKVVLSPDNKAYERQTLDKKSLTILGRVKSVTREL